MRRGTRAVIGGLLLAAAVLAGDLASALTGARMAPLSVPIAAGAATPSEAGPCVAGWRELPVPDRAFRATPSELLVQDGEPAWALGTTSDGVLALRWDGAAWRWTDTPTSGQAGVSGGALIGRRSLLAVGYRLTETGRPRPISGRIQRSAWHARTVPEPPGGDAVLNDVIRLRDGTAWAVGTRYERGRQRAYALRWTGSRWARQEPALGSGSGLQAVERAPGGTIWAVGWREASLGVPRPYIVRRTRTGWVRMAAPTLPAGAAVLTDVRFRSAREGWAVGYLGPRSNDEHRVFLLRWNGRRWSRVAVPWADDVAAIPRSLAVSAGGGLWIAGTQTATASREPRGFLAHRRGGSWQVDVLGTPDDIRSEVRAVSATAAGAIAAAQVESSLLMLESCSAGAGAAADRRARVRISEMPARRRTRQEEDLGAAEAAGGSQTAASRRLPPLPAPVASPRVAVRDMTGAAGLTQTTETYGGFATDMDGDGDRDLFFSLHSNQPRLAMNTGGAFRDAPTTAFTDTDRHGCDVADVDGDGTRDILCAIGAARGKAIKRHDLSLAPATEGGAVARSGLGISDPLSRGRRVAFLRLDGDRYPEVFITSSPNRADGLPSYSRLYRNVGGRFVPARSQGLDSSDDGTCAETVDIDRDGDDDLVYCAGAFGKRRAGLRVMRNERGTLRDRTAALGVRPIKDRDVAFGDVTGDGRRDLVQVSANRLRISRWTRQGFKLIYEARVTHGVAVATGDVDGDGRHDVYVAMTGFPANRPDHLLLSRNDGRRFISLKIPQTTAGAADDVISLDYDQNGLADFVILNGRTRPGPVKLLAAFPPTTEP